MTDWASENYVKTDKLEPEPEPEPNFPFRIEALSIAHALVWISGGSRPATEPEVMMWNALKKLKYV